MFTIQLNNLRFFSFHGLYKEERILGNEYEVDVAITIAAHEPVTALHQTIDYVKIYHIIKEQMNIPTPLLETVVQNLADHIYTSDNRITSINISIKKLYPPIAEFIGNVGVNFKKDY